MNKLRHLAVLAAVLFSANAACAWPFWDWLTTHDAPPAYYTPARYWAPAAARVNDDIHGPRLGVYAPNRHPEIPPNVTIIPASGPYLLPGETIIPLPTPPATSRAR